MSYEEPKTVETVIRAALKSKRDDFRLRLAEHFRKEGFPALSVGKEPVRPDRPSVVVFEDPKYAVVYLFTGACMNDAEFEAFRTEARAFAWQHDAAAYFVRLDDGVILKETD